MSESPERDLSKVETGVGGDYGNHEQQLRNVLTNTMSLSPELFERLYLSQQTRVSGELRRTFANPTPLGVLGFAVALFPLSIELMGWRSSGGVDGSQTTTCSLFFGGALLWLAGAGEFLLGNTFPTIVFFTYGAHYFTYATTFVPGYGAIAYSSGGDAFKPTALFASGFGFYTLAMALLSFLFMLGALRINVVFVVVFFCATIGFGFATAANWHAALGATAISETCLIGAGAVFFVADLAGWYLGFAQIFAIMELPLPDIPVGDLSTRIKAKARKTA